MHIYSKISLLINLSVQVARSTGNLQLAFGLVNKLAHADQVQCLPCTYMLTRRVKFFTMNLMEVALCSPRFFLEGMMNMVQLMKNS